jgi:gibberellin-44 dioxygenase
VYQKYCEAMKELSLVIMELLAISLGIDRMHYRRFFEDGDSIMRCNYYPPCQSSSLTLGTGPHSDPTSLTILHQDQVGGLEVFADNKWVAVRPRPEALVINIGDTFMVCKTTIFFLTILLSYDHLVCMLFFLILNNVIIIYWFFFVCVYF